VKAEFRQSQRLGLGLPATLNARIAQLLRAYLSLSSREAQLTLRKDPAPHDSRVFVLCDDLNELLERLELKVPPRVLLLPIPSRDRM